MTEQPRLHHLLDRMRRGDLLPAEADQLATFVGELEARVVTLKHVAAGNKRHVQLIVPDLEKAAARVTELEAEVVRLTAGQCVDSRRMCDLHHHQPVTGCPYPRCLTAREQTTTA